MPGHHERAGERPSRLERKIECIEDRRKEYLRKLYIASEDPNNGLNSREDRNLFIAKINQKFDDQIEECRRQHVHGGTDGSVDDDYATLTPVRQRGRKRFYSECSARIQDKPKSYPKSEQFCSDEDLERQSNSEETKEEDDDDDDDSAERSSDGVIDASGEVQENPPDDEKESVSSAVAMDDTRIRGRNDEESSDNHQQIDDDLAGGGNSQRNHKENRASRVSPDDNVDTPEPDEDEDDYDLVKDPEPRRQREKIIKSNLSIAIQGFRSTQKARGESTNEQPNPANQNLFDPEQITFNGRVFYNGLCYNYKVEQGSTRSSHAVTVIVGIKRFVTRQQAECVLVVPFEDTFLGMEEEGVDYQANFRPFSHCQVHEKVSILSLKNMAGRAPGIDGIPKWIYEPQTEGSWNRFGYFLDDSAGRVKRKGRREELRVLELFAGAGGMHLGFANAGFTTVEAVDNDILAVATMKKNCPGVPVVRCDVNSYLEQYEDQATRDSLLGRIGHINATPPCKGFSGANRMGGRNDKKNNDLSLTLIDAVRIFRPLSATFENVLGMWRRKHVHYLKNLVKGLMISGYQVRVSELRACDYGSAQIRPRLILFATHQSAPPPKIPEKTHGNEGNLLPFVTVQDVLSGLEDGNDRLGHPLRNTWHATTSLNAGEHGVVKLRADGFSPAIRTGVPPLHYHHDRCISVRECATLQDFPTTFEFCGTMGQQYCQVGNAVPVELATKIAQAVREILVFKYE
ncbi:methyltransferase 1 [Seminavis robusta]|uniref:DNA (cytosine-5-)-methyltransferase n=1 Tax=Seminavis robusta TaxID=568900 RepID=A0A9N8HBD9_9STRA|nr:methyltransferase 1 [Seminavis robusta]|eukprot:Sro257_g100900.1 methyltransferase 1 (742) ;mRNA; f:53603-55828